jgi:hypothetical protein
MTLNRSLLYLSFTFVYFNLCLLYKIMRRMGRGERKWMFFIADFLSIEAEELKNSYCFVVVIIIQRRMAGATTIYSNIYVLQRYNC